MNNFHKILTSLSFILFFFWAIISDVRMCVCIHKIFIVLFSPEQFKSGPYNQKKNQNFHSLPLLLHFTIIVFYYPLLILLLKHHRQTHTHTLSNYFFVYLSVCCAGEEIKVFVTAAIHLTSRETKTLLLSILDK
jgi:hypothetical protein